MGAQVFFFVGFLFVSYGFCSNCYLILFYQIFVVVVFVSLAFWSSLLFLLLFHCVVVANLITI